MTKAGYGIDMNPIYEEELTPSQFVKLYEGKHGDIRSVRILPARLGENGYGHIIVTRRTAKFSTINFGSIPATGIPSE
jgi:hypothetical protein